MSKYFLHIFFLILLCPPFAYNQNSTIITDIKVTNSKLVKLGKSRPIHELAQKSATSPFKKKLNKRNKSVPDNFKGRRGKSKAVHFNKEHLGPDPIRQNDLEGQFTLAPSLLNFNGLGDNGSPHDPTGDISDKYYVQMVNVTDIGVFDLSGKLIAEFTANTLWSEFSKFSAGDPIVLYDENADRWILTEFSSPANVLIAISDGADPLGSYTAYNFNTPSFPDYPKYGLSPDILTLTTNENGTGDLHNYFFDLKAMYAGDEEVNMQRIRVNGNDATEAGFYVTTPVDRNGSLPPFDNKPITLLLNDSSWEGGPDQDQIEVFTFDIDFINPGLTEVKKTVIITSPFDPYPCSETGFGFACIPQKEGPGLDGVPEIIMNTPHLRKFENHESMVLSFITDVSNGNNISGIRWMELRREGANDNWELYQEGSFGPQDGIHRFMPSIAIDDKGSIGLAYNVSSQDIFVGARYTGRKKNDPLGMMTVKEVSIVEGKGAIFSGERFGDYSQMSVSPKNDNTFWWTSEYAGEGKKVTQTRIVAFQITKDSFDLGVSTISNPITKSGLTSSEAVEITLINEGIYKMSDFSVQLLLNDSLLETRRINQVIEPDSTFHFTFQTTIDMSLVDEYKIGAIIYSLKDSNPSNDTIFTKVRNIYELDAEISGEIEQDGCADSTIAFIEILNDGALTIDSLAYLIEVNGNLWDTLTIIGPLEFKQKKQIIYSGLKLPPGPNEVRFSLFHINTERNDDFIENNNISLSTIQMPSDHFITINFTTDKFPEENKWSLYFEGRNELITMGEFNEAERTISTKVCVNPDSCFVFIVNDVYGDGICCNYGNGNFNITDNAGQFIVNNNGEFGAKAEISFCGRGQACALSYKTSTSDVSAFGQSDGIILIEISTGIGPFLYSIDDGKTYQDSPLFEELSPGIYVISVIQENGLCESKSLVELGYSSSIKDIHNNEMVVEISPNPSSDVFAIRMLNTDIAEPMVVVEILDMAGQLLQQRSINQYNGIFTSTFSLMPYPPGTYLIRIKTSNFSYMNKILRVE